MPFQVPFASLQALLLMRKTPPRLPAAACGVLRAEIENALPAREVPFFVLRSR